MKLLDLHIHGFGKFHDRTVTFEDGLNIVYGKNEAGKSTLHTFIRGMLFGIEKQRGRASKNDLYNKFEPWKSSGTYEGILHVEYQGNIYRIERNFQKNSKSLTVVNETEGKEVPSPEDFMNSLLCGLSETAYNNTVSIGQLKSATESGMVHELKNYIANMNTSGNMALNITKASAFLKNQRKEYEAQMVPDAARSYTSLLGEIKAVEQETTSPEYENKLTAFQKQRLEAKKQLEEKQKEKEGLLQRVARGRQILSQNQFSDLNSITDFERHVQDLYQEYIDEKKLFEKKSRKIFRILFLVLGTLFIAAAGYLCFLLYKNPASVNIGIPPLLLCGGLTCLAILFYTLAIVSVVSGRRLQKDVEVTGQMLSELFSRHLGDESVSEQAMEAFGKRMEEFKRLSETMDKSEAAVEELAQNIASLSEQQDTCTQAIEAQQKNQWELEKKLERLASCKTRAEGMKHVLAENERISLELSAIDLAQEVMTELSTSIRDSFGLYLNKTASELISGITGGTYTSVSIDENLNPFMNTPDKLVPLEQVSTGTMDQIYLALRLAAAKLIQNGEDQLPLIFDDSFVLYDDERLKSALKWLASSYGGQIIIFTCHQREAQMLTANLIPYHMISI